MFLSAECQALGRPLVHLKTLSFQKMLDNLPAHHLPDICASIIKASYSERIQVLDAVDLTERFKKTLPLLMRQIEVGQIKKLIYMLKFEVLYFKESRLSWLSTTEFASKVASIFC
jgi:ATP-dependent Lon protease